MSKKTELVDMLMLHLARIGKEKGNTVEQHKYGRRGDPCKSRGVLIRDSPSKAIARLGKGEVMLKRVRKEDVIADSWVKRDGLLYCLDCWKAWMHGDADRDLGAKPMGGLAGDTDCYGVSPSEQQQARDTRIAIATDAMIDSLKRIHIWAIYTSCSVGKVWNYPNADLVMVADEARMALTEKLKKNVCTGVLF